MVREDLIEGAISFLQDPSVAAAPLDQRIAFLRSKNLTQEEIDTSLARVGAPPAPPSASSPPQYQPPHHTPPPPYGYPPQQAYWPPPPPDPPRRDWRDWFIMATVVGGLGSAAYWTAKRYVYPLLAPPTPPLLEQDKQRVDDAFKQAFDLLEQLSKDTTELKAAETHRKARLDAALADVEGLVARLKTA
ncbi:peroxin 14, partial [Teratosphaeria destructans]